MLVLSGETDQKMVDEPSASRTMSLPTFMSCTEILKEPVTDINHAPYLCDGRRVGFH